MVCQPTTICKRSARFVVAASAQSAVIIISLSRSVLIMVFWLAVILLFGTSEYRFKIGDFAPVEAG